MTEAYRIASVFSVQNIVNNPLLGPNITMTKKPDISWRQSPCKKYRLNHLKEGSPVYTVEPENGRDHQKTLHRTMLLPCNALPVEAPPDSPVMRPVKRIKKFSNVKLGE